MTSRLNTNRRLVISGTAALALSTCPLPSYALADTIVTDALKVLVFGAAGLVFIVAGLVALVALATGNKATSKGSAIVAAVAMVAGLLCMPDLSSSHYVTPEEQLQQVPHPFGLVSTPGPTDQPMAIPPLQTDTAIGNQTAYHKVYTYLPDMPQLPGGNTEAIQFVRQHLRYPAAARTHHTIGLVAVRFIVNEEGQVAHARVIKSLGNGCDEEALRIVRGLPCFTNDQQVPVEFKWYFSFRPPEEVVSQTD